MQPLERYVRFLVRRAWFVLGAVAILTVTIATGMGKLRQEYDIEKSLPANHPYVQTDRAIRREFGGRTTSIIALIPRDGGSVWRPEVLEVVRAVTTQALGLEGVIAQNVVSLSAPSVRWVHESGGSIVVDYLMNEVPRTPEAIAELRRRVDDDPQLKGMLVTPDEKAAIVLVDFYEGMPSHELAQRILSLREPFRDAPVDFYFAGEPVMSLADLAQTTQVKHRIPLTFLVVAVMLLVSFRSIQGMVIPMLTATLSTIWALGLMGHTGIVIDVWNAAVPILLVAIAAAHSAQMLKRYTEEVLRTGDNRAAVIESTVKVGPVMIAAGTVAALGFASLALFGVPAIANFGLSCTYGIGSAVLLEMTFIPALRALLPAPRHLPHQDGVTDRLLGTLERGILLYRGWAVIAGTLLVLAVVAVGITRIRTYGPTKEYMPVGSLPRDHLDVIEKHFPGTVTMTLLYEGEPGTTKRVEVLEHMDALQSELGRDPLVWRTASMADLVKVLHRTFNADVPDPYRIPDDQNLVAQLLFLGDSPAFERFTDRAQSRGLVMAYLTDDDSARVGPLLHHVERWLVEHPAPAGTRVLVAGGSGPIVLAVNEHTTRGKLLNMLVVLATIWLVSSIMLRSPQGGLYVILPIVLTLVELFGVLGWTGIRLDMGSSSIIAMACGVGADYAIYFLYRLREERARTTSDAAALSAAMHTSGRAVVFVAASIGAGFGVMGFTEFRALQLFGRFMPAAMALSCLAALSLLPVLVMRNRPRFVFGDRAEVDEAPAVTPARQRAAAAAGPPGS